MRRMLRLSVLIAYCVILCAFAAGFPVKAEDNLGRQYHILFISSYGYSNAGVPEQLKGFEEGIDGLNVEISYEFMDAEKFYGSTDIANFDKYLRYKVFSLRNYDLIAVADDPALRYAINNRNKLFPDIPMVFMGINNITEAVTASSMRGATGIAENQDFESNFRLMEALFPKRENVVVIVDSTVTGQGDYVEFMKYKENHGDISSRVINTSYYTQNGLKEALMSLNRNDIILFLDFSVDGDKNSYSLENASDFLSTYASGIPIFRLSSSDIGHGVFGGLSYSFYDAGKIAGNAAKEILSGANPDDMPLMTSTVTTPYFEQGKLDEYNIRHFMIPPDSIVINEHQNFAKFYRDNKVISNLVIIVAILMIAIIALLYSSNKKRLQMIRTDFLTQMPNRQRLMEEIGQAVEGKKPYGLLMLDVDHFKGINDTYGHKIGDEIIRLVADRLKNLADEDLTFARLGGDEFSGIFYGPSDKKAAYICEIIVEVMRKEFATTVGNMNITISVGCALYPQDTENPERLMECADRALYETKERGRDGYTLFSTIN